MGESSQPGDQGRESGNPAAAQGTRHTAPPAPGSHRFHSESQLRCQGNEPDLKRVAGRGGGALDWSPRPAAPWLLSLSAPGTLCPGWGSSLRAAATHLAWPGGGPNARVTSHSSFGVSPGRVLGPERGQQTGEVQGAGWELAPHPKLGGRHGLGCTDLPAHCPGSGPACTSTRPHAGACESVYPEPAQCQSCRCSGKRPQLSS